jgi:hypothetical protein
MRTSLRSKSRVGRCADSPRAIPARFTRGATGDATGSRRYTMYCPPFTSMTCPVTYPDSSSEAR